MRAEIVLDQHNLFGAGKMRIRQFFQHLSVIGGVGDLDATPAFQRKRCLDPIFKFPCARAIIRGVIWRSAYAYARA